jgi:hypothetical protein
VNSWSINNNKSQQPYTKISGEFRGDVIMSVVPLKERQKYNPNLLRSSYKKKLMLYKGLSIGSLVTMASSFTGSLACGILFGIGNYYYPNPPGGDFTSYYYMQDVGFYAMIAFGCLGIAALIPLILSHTVIRKRLEIAKNYTPVIGFGKDTLIIGARVRMGGRKF